MDAIETARQIASSLHRAAVEMGCDPWRPYSFALVEAERQGLMSRRRRLAPLCSAAGERHTFQDSA